MGRSFYLFTRQSGMIYAMSMLKYDDNKNPSLPKK
jgi:hypothetical protein